MTTSSPPTGPTPVAMTSPVASPTSAPASTSPAPARPPWLIDRAATPVPIGPTQTSYRYDNLYLLTVNDGRYFVFDQLAADCTPAHVYIIREEDVRSAQYVTAAPPTCAAP